MINPECFQYVDQVQFPTFESLPNSFANAGSTTEVFGQIEMLFQGKQKCWRQKFEALTMLRILNKHFAPHINTVFETFGLRIIECLESNVTNLTRNSLLFVAEVFIHKQTELNPAILSECLPRITQTAALTELNSLKEEANFALLCMVNSSFNMYSMIPTLCTMCNDNQVKVQFMAVKMLARVLELSKQNITMFQPQILSMLAKTLVQLLDNKRQDVFNFGLQISMFLYSVLGQINFQTLLQTFLDAKEINTVMQKMEEGFKKQAQKNSVKQQSFKDYRNSIFQMNKENISN